MLVNIDFKTPESLTIEDFKDNISGLPQFISNSFGIDNIREMYKTNIYPVKISDGIYDAWSLDEKYFEIYCKSHEMIGLVDAVSCDNVGQVLDGEYNLIINDANRKIVLLVCSVDKNKMLNGNYIKWEILPRYIGSIKQTKEFIHQEEKLNSLKLIKIVELKEKYNGIK